MDVMLVWIQACTVCQEVRFSLCIHYIKLDKTSWTYSMLVMWINWDLIEYSLLIYTRLHSVPLLVSAMLLHNVCYNVYMCSSGLGTGLSLNPLLAWLWSLLRLSDWGSTLWLRVGLKRLNRRNGSASEPEMMLDRRDEVLRPPPCQSSTLVCTRKLSIRYLASLRWNLVRSQASPWRASFNSSSITTLSWNLQYNQLQLVSLQGDLVKFYIDGLLTLKVTFTAPFFKL